MSDLLRFAQDWLARVRAAQHPAAEVSLARHQRTVWLADGTARAKGTPDTSSQSRTLFSAGLWVHGADGRVWHAGLAAAEGVDLAAAFPSLLQQALQDTPKTGAGPLARLEPSTRGLAIDDPRRHRLEANDRREVLTWNWGAVRTTHNRIRPLRFVLTEQLTERLYASSRGFHLAESSTRFGLQGQLSLVGKAGERQITGQLSSRLFADVASRPLGAELAGRLEAGERAARLPAERLPLVLEPHVLAEILAVLPPAFAAERLDQGQSVVGRLRGQRIAPSWLHLVDDAGVSSGLNSRSFDGRGIPPVPVPLIREGTLTGIYLDPEQARVRNARPTGHRHATGRLWPGNLVLRAGNRTRNMVFADLGRYLCAVHLIAPPQLDPASGQLALQLWLTLDGPDRNPSRLGAWAIRTDLASFLGSFQQLASDESRQDGVFTCTAVTEGLPLEEI